MIEYIAMTMIGLKGKPSYDLAKATLTIIYRFHLPLPANLLSHLKGTFTGITSFERPTYTTPPLLRRRPITCGQVTQVVRSFRTPP